MDYTGNEHFKGEYLNIYKVHEDYPAGGADGDFVVIGGYEHHWNASRGEWVVSRDRDEYWNTQFARMDKHVLDHTLNGLTATAQATTVKIGTELGAGADKTSGPSVILPAATPTSAGMMTGANKQSLDKLIAIIKSEELHHQPDMDLTLGIDKSMSKGRILASAGRYQVNEEGRVVGFMEVYASPDGARLHEVLTSCYRPSVQCGCNCWKYDDQMHVTHRYYDIASARWSSWAEAVASVGSSIPDEPTDTPIDKPAQPEAVVYDGEAHAIALEGEGYTIEGENSVINAGTHTVMLKLKAGYVWSDGDKGDYEVTLVVEKATCEVVVTGVADLVYDGNNKTLAEESNPHELRILWSVKKNREQVAQAPIVQNAGIYEVTWSVEESDNYLGDGGTFDVVIAKAECPVKLTPKPHKYTVNPSPIYELENPQGQVVNIDFFKDGMKVSAPTDAGTYTVRWSVTETKNYRGAFNQEFDVEIQPADNTISWNPVPPTSVEVGENITFGVSATNGRVTVFKEGEDTPVTSPLSTTETGSIKLIAKNEVISSNFNTAADSEKNINVVAPYYYIGSGNYDDLDWDTTGWYKNNSNASGTIDTPIAKVATEDGIGIKVKSAYKIEITVYDSTGAEYVQEMVLQQTKDGYDYYMVDGYENVGFKITNIKYSKK